MAKKKNPSLIAAAQAAAKKQQSREQQNARLQAAQRLRAGNSLSGAISAMTDPGRRTQSVNNAYFRRAQSRNVLLEEADRERRERLERQNAQRRALENAAMNRANQLAGNYAGQSASNAALAPARQTGYAPVQNDPLHDRLVQDVAATGRLPSGYSWYGKGSDAIAVDNRGLAYKPLEGVTAGSRAATPAVYGIDPDKYLQHMQAYDAWEAEKGNMPKAAKRAQEYLQPAIDAETDPVRKAELQKQLDAVIAAEAYSPAEQRKRNRLEKAAMEAVGYLGKDIGQYAGRSDMDYLRSYGQQFGIQQEGEEYRESSKSPINRKLYGLIGADEREHAEAMWAMHNEDVYGLAYNPHDAIESGFSQQLQGMTDEEKKTYMGIASRYGASTANAYWNALADEGQYGQKAYSLRDAAYRDMADKSWLGSSALSVASNVASISGTLYGFAQKMTGKEIDPYADQFMFGQMTGAIRDEVGQNITRNFGNEDGTDNFGSWLMKTGYNAGMSSLDSLVAGKLSGGSALAGSMMQGFSGASSVIQDAKLRGATDEQALLLGGLSVVTETATEYIPMDTLLETIDGKDVVNFRQLLTNALKGGLSEAPGEGLSEVLSVISDNQIMGAMSNYNLNVEAYMRTGMTEDEARRKASGDVIWDVFNAAATGFLSGEGSNLMAGSRSLAANALMPNNTADYQGTVEAVRKLAETTGDAELRTIAEQAGQEMSHTGNVEAAKQGVVDRMMAAADAVVAKQQNTAQSAAAAITENENGVSMFDQPMQASFADKESGGDVSVVGFDTTTDGRDVILHTVDQNGNEGTATIAELEFADETVSDLLNADDVRGLDGQGLRNYLSGYAAEVDGHSVAPGEYAKAYGMVYRRAAAGMDMDQAIGSSVIPRVMTETAMQDAYVAGLGAAAQQQTAAPLSPATTGNAGVMNRSFTKAAWQSMSRQQQRTAAANMEVVGQLAKRMNATINIVDSLTDGNGGKVNGRFDPSTGVIDIALDADGNAYAYVAMHELTHKMKAEHAKEFDTFAEWVQEGLQESGQDFEALVQYQMDTFGYSREDAIEEVLCNTVPALLESEENLRKLYKQDKSLFERVMDWLKGLIADVQAAGKNLSQRSRSWAQMDALAADEAQLQGLYDVMESIMQSEGENAGGNSAVKESRKDNGESKHYDYSKPFAEQIDDWLNGTFPEKDTLLISTTPDVLQRIGFSKLPMAYDQKHMRKVLGNPKNRDHDLGVDFMKKLPELIADPVAILSTPKRDGSIIMVLAHKNEKASNRPVVAFVSPLVGGGYNTIYVDANKTETVHSRGDLSEIIKAAVETEKAGGVGVYYVAEKKSLHSVLEHGQSQVLDSLNRTGYLHSIHDVGSDVNVELVPQTESRQFTHWFRGSQVVNPDGTPKAMYHGTATEFWAFDKKKANDLTGRRLGLGAGKGKFYLTEYRGSAQLAADSAQQTGRGTSPKVMELYVSAKKVMDRSEYDQRLQEAYKQYPNSDPRGSGYDYRQRDKAVAAVDKAIQKEGYDGVWDRDSGEMFVYEATQIKSATDNVGLFDRTNPDIRYSRSDFDSAYSTAVEQGDTDKAKELVAQAAEASMPDSKLRTPDGKLRVVYHGTGDSDFTVFDSKFIGSASGDDGYFGQGFYFAYTEREASYYGIDRIIPAYLNLTNPFNFEKELYSYEGTKIARGYNAVDAVALMNWADKFPEIAKKRDILVGEKGSDSHYISLREFADRFKEIIANKKFVYQKQTNEYGEEETLVLADPKVYEYEVGGEKRSFTDYEYQKHVQGEVDHLMIAYDYLSTKVFSYVDMPNFTKVILDHNTEFTAALKEMGYDGVIQSEGGDEAVAFEPSQIKSAEPVTYDDAGKVIPLSERFQMEEPDFRYSMSDYDATVKEGDVVLEDLLTMTAAHKMTDAEARRVAQKALKAGSSTMDADDAARRIKEIFDYASRSGKVDVDGLNSEVRALAEEMMSQSATLDEQHEADVADLRNYLKTTPIALSPGQQREAAHLMDSYGAYRRALFGQVNLRKSGIGLDQVWGELNEMYPHLFPADTSEGDQVRVLMDIAEYVKPVYRNETGFNMEESIQWMTHEIYNAYMSLSGVQSAAKEQNRLGLKLRDYRAITKRFAQEHKAAYEEMAARVASAADRRVAEAESKAERRADMAIRDAEDTAAREIRKAQEQARQDITDAVSAEMQFSNSRIQEAQMRAEAYIKKVSDADKKARYQAQIIREANQMIKKLEKPTDKNHVQHELAEPLAEFLRSLNTGRKTVDQRALGDRIIRLKLKMAAAGAEGEGHSVMVDPDMLATMEFLGEQLKHTTSLDELNVEQMMRIRNIVHHASWIVGKADEAFADARRKRISDSANEWLAQVERRKDVKEAKHVGKLKNLLEVGQLDAFHFFDKLGGTARDMFQNLRDGWDKKIRHRADAMEFVEQAKEGLSKNAQKELFAGKRAKKETYTLTNGSIELTRPQLMELYCLAKRPQARMHLFSEKGGIRSTEGRRLQVTEEDVQKLTDNLTAEEKKLADTLQRYMVDECARWGNETSMNLYGYQKFTEENYYPIRVDQHSVESNISESGKTENLYAVANMGMTKALQDVVTNGLMLGDIFDTFSRHVDNMATYNGLAAPITDLVRWYNYKGKDSSVKEELAFKFGREYMEYIPRLIRDINGEKDKSYNPGITDKWLSNMKSSAVGSNLRVIIQQPTAILRAGSMMSYQYIMAGMAGLSGESGRRKISEASELAKKYCPIAALKAMGFYETDLGKSMRTAMFDDRGAIDKAKDVGMSLAGKADEMTFGMIWRACEAEIRKTQPDLKVGSQQYYKAVGVRMGEIIDYTQVVDTPLHRTQLMRSKNALVKMGTTFMSEPSKTYNMIYGAVSNLIENRKDPVAKRKLARTLGAFTITGVVNGIAQSLIDAIRDDEEEEWWKKFCYHFFGDYREANNLWKHFLAFRKSNLWQGWNIVGSIPYIKDVISLIDGWDIKRVDMQSAEKLVQVGDNVVKLFTGKNKLNGFGWSKQVGTAVDAVTGLSLSNLLRDGYAMTNFLFGCFGAEAPVTMQTEAATTSVGYNNLYRAMASGNASKFNRVSGKMASKHKSSERDIDTAMAERFAEAGDEQIVNAYTAKAEGRASEYGRIRDSFVAEYSEMIGETRATELFDKAVSRYDSLLNNTSNTEEKKAETKPLKANAFTNKEMGKVFAGLANGTVSEADAEFVLSEMIADSEADDPAKTVRTNLWAQLKPMYLVAEGEEKKALANVIKKYCGKTDKDLQKAEKDAAKKATEDESK